MVASAKRPIRLRQPERELLRFRPARLVGNPGSGFGRAAEALPNPLFCRSWTVHFANKTHIAHIAFANRLTPSSGPVDAAAVHSFRFLSGSFRASRALRASRA